MTAASKPACAIPGTPLALAAKGLDLCVHCGFCLQACPTYLALDDENDSPRGRLVIMKGLVEGDIALDDPAVATHLDRCLGCRGCETACPSGVPYGHLLEAARATLITRRPLPWVARAILGAFKRPKLLTVALGGGWLMRTIGLSRLFARLPGRLGFAFAMLESSRPWVQEQRYPIPPTPPAPRARVALLHGCVMKGLFAHTNRATKRVLSANGYQLCQAPGEECCGALHAHAGDAEGAKTLARRNVAAFEASGADFIAVNASGCGAMMKEYGHLLSNDPDWSQRAHNVSQRVRDVSELLADVGPINGALLTKRVTYDAPCHLVHAQRVTAQPLAVLAAIPGLEIRPLVDADQCCGSAGIYNLIEPATSDAVLAPKLAHLAGTGADLVVTGNPGCLMQIGAGLIRAGSSMRVVHPIDLLDASYAQLNRGPNDAH